MQASFRVLKQLADGRFHSGEKMAAELGISRTAVWKHLKKIMSLGIDIHAVTGKGYRLAQTIEFLDHAEISEQIQDDVRALLDKLEICWEVESTNQVLMDRAIKGERRGQVLIAEQQNAGRGRHGRRWVSPFAANLYLSVLWRFEAAPAQLGALSPVMAVIVARALTKTGLDSVALKWPNDIYFQNRKLAGILLEVTGESSGPSTVVVGVGINLSMPSSSAAEIDQAWIDVNTALGRPVSRNCLAGILIDQMLRGLRDYEKNGISSFADEWRASDLSFGRRVKLTMNSQSVEGIAQGITDGGSLVLEHNGQISHHSSGELSLRITA